MELGLYAHPFGFGDLDPHGGPRGVAALGFAEIAIAAAYHAGRWLVPSRSGGLVRFLEDGVVHARLGTGYGVLRARESRQVPPSGPSPLEASCRQAKEAGLSTVAWTVLFHNSRLGALHPESCVENACGDRYEYALCPARPEVRDLAKALVADVARTPALDAIELEAAGWMGHKHGSHHDKSSLALDPYADFLLSYCFCSACRAGLHGLGVDAERTRSRVLELLQARISDGDALVETRIGAERLVEDLGADTHAALLEHRRTRSVDLLKTLRAELPRGIRLLVQVEPDPRGTGSQLGIEPARLAGCCDEVVVTHYGGGPEPIERQLRALAVPAGMPVRLGIWPRAPHFRGEQDLQRVREAAESRGVAGVRVYHAGLLPAKTLQRSAAALRGS